VQRIECKDCLSARERSSLGAAQRDLVPSIFPYFLDANELKNHVLLAILQFFDDFFDFLVIRAKKAAKSPFFVLRDRREREFACILGYFYGKIPGWGGVYTATRAIFVFLLAIDHVIR